MRYFVCLCCLTAILCSSLPAFAMSLTDFESRCTMGADTDKEGSCAAKKDICGSFMDALSSAKDKEACKKACSDSNAAITPKHAADGCQSTVEHAYSECTVYCETLK